MLKSLFTVTFTSFLMLSTNCLAITNYDVSDAMKEKLNYLGQRQAVISKNIANANTPGYKTKDLEPVTFNKFAKTNVKYKEIIARDVYDTKPDGNNVSIEEQMVKMSENNLEYQTTLSLIKKIGDMKRTALGSK